MPKLLPDVNERASVFRANYVRLHGDWRVQRESERARERGREGGRAGETLVVRKERQFGRSKEQR